MMTLEKDSVQTCPTTFLLLPHYKYEASSDLLRLNNKQTYKASRLRLYEVSSKNSQGSHNPEKMMEEQRCRAQDFIYICSEYRSQSSPLVRKTQITQGISKQS